MYNLAPKINQPSSSAYLASTSAICKIVLSPYLTQSEILHRTDRPKRIAWSEYESSVGNQEAGKPVGFKESIATYLSPFKINSSHGIVGFSLQLFIGEYCSAASIIILILLRSLLWF